MTTFRKNISVIVLLIALAFVILFYSAIYPMNSENTNIGSKNTIINEQTKGTDILHKENSNKFCNSSTGFCGPPIDWYPTK